MATGRLRMLAATALAAVVMLIAAPAYAQELPKYQSEPPPKGGICAPWHRCVAYAALALGGVSVVIFGLGYVVQSRGFDRLEHRQGNPEGVPVAKE